MLVRLRVTEGPHRGDTFTFEQHDNVLVGRSKKAHFRLLQKDETLSRIHFMAEFNPPYCRLMDMESTNGTIVNGKKIKSADLKHGDEIQVGLTSIRVEILDTSDDDAEAPAQPSLEGNGAVRSTFETIQTVPVGGPSWAAPDDQPPWYKDVVPATPSPVKPPTEVVSRPPVSVPVPPPQIRPGSQETEAVPIVGAGPRKVVTPCPICSAPSDPSPARHELARPLCPECRESVESQAQPIEGYLLVRELGRGGMGTVHQAISLEDEQVVALKAVIPNVCGTEAQIQRFIREANILRSLQHPNIVKFHDIGESKGQLYFAMEYVAGIDAARWLKTYPQGAPIPRAVTLVCHMLRALEHAHEKGFVHRDIKPSNLLIARSEGVGRGKLADFGLARVYQCSKLSGLTMMNDVAGTVAYSAPEQITNFRQTQPAADQYSSAVTLYALLTGQTPFPRVATLQQQILQLIDKDPIEIRERRAEIPEGLASAIHKAMQKSPQQRFASVAEFRAALTPFARG